MGSKIKAIQILQAAGYILLGLFLVLKPDTSVRAICYGCGVIAAAYGLLHDMAARNAKSMRFCAAAGRLFRLCFCF